MTLDTVKLAQENPNSPQPYKELGLKDDEYERIRTILGRRPTSSELAMYSVMGSEHCSYKSSKIHLKQFGEKAVKSDALLVGIGENAGVVDVGQGYAVTFKIESPTEITVVGIDKQLVGETAAKIQKLRKSDPYKGKGLHLDGARIRRKQGKTGKK